MSKQGTVLSTYGTVEAGSKPGQMNRPQSLVTDKFGYIAVADENNNKIIVLNPTFSEVRDFSLPLNDTGEINNPRGLWLDESQCRLYVGEWGGQKRVLVFDNVCNLYDSSSSVQLSCMPGIQGL
jgi:DNA-binding beta-propeller fold protein YncE